MCYYVNNVLYCIILLHCPPHGFNNVVYCSWVIFDLLHALTMYNCEVHEGWPRGPSWTYDEANKI